MALAPPSSGVGGARAWAERLARRHSTAVPLVVLAAVMVATAIVVMHAGRRTTFFYDDWNFVTMRIGWRPHVLLYPHNEHLSLVPVLIYKLLFETVGLRHYGAFRAVDVTLDLTCGLLFFLYLRRRITSWPAVALAACLMLMGAAAYDLVWPFQIGFIGSVTAGLGALLALDARTRRGDILACFLVCVSLASSSIGLAVLAGVAVDVLVRADRRRRWWIFAVPAALYGLWYLKYGYSQASLANIPHVPGEIWGGLTASVTALTGLPGDYGGALAAGLIVLVLAELARPGPLRARLLALVAIPVTFWTLAALARSNLPPSEARYLYPTGLFVGLLAGEALLRFRPSPRAAAFAAVVLGAAALGSASGINAFGDGWRGFATNTMTSLTAAQILGSLLPPQTIPDPGQPQLAWGHYEEAERAYGSSVGWTPAELARRPDGDRAGVDAALVRLSGPAPAPVSSRPRTTACVRHPGGGGDSTQIVPPHGLYIRAGTQPVEFRFRRFGDSLPTDASTNLPAGGQGVLTLAADTSQVPWRAATRSAVPYITCTVG